MSLLFQLLNEIARHKIKIYEFPDCDDDEENRHQKKLKVRLWNDTSLYLHDVALTVEISVHFQNFTQFTM